MERSNYLFFQVQYNKIYFIWVIEVGILQEKLKMSVGWYEVMKEVIDFNEYAIVDLGWRQQFMQNRCILVYWEERL